MAFLSETQIQELAQSVKQKKFFKTKISSLGYSEGIMDELIDRAEFREGEIRVVKNGKPIDLSYYVKPIIRGMYGYRAVHKESLISLLNDGCTLVLESLDEKDTYFFELKKYFQSCFDSKCWVNCYLTPMFSKGFDWHSDAHDVIIIQASGNKKWAVRCDEQEIDFISETHDLFYIPKGVAHCAKATDSYSFHFTIGFQSDIKLIAESNYSGIFNKIQKAGSLNAESIICKKREFKLISGDSNITILSETIEMSFSSNAYSFLFELSEKNEFQLNKSDSILSLDNKIKVSKSLYMNGIVDVIPN